MESMIALFRRNCRLLLPLLASAAAIFASGCRTANPGQIVHRRGDEIVIAGQFVHTGTPVVLWMDPGGYDAYRVERRFAPIDQSDWEKSRPTFTNNVPNPSPNRFGLRRAVLTSDQAEKVRGGGWDLPLLQNVVDQFVYHFDASGTSRQCFKVLHDVRDLSVHFMLDLDGTIYQTLDVKERAWHATTSNSRSVGIEIANIGAFPENQKSPLNDWYKTDAHRKVHIKIPAEFGNGGLRTSNFVARPARPGPILGTVQKQQLVQYDFTPEQYRSLIKLTATVCKVLPKIRCDYPRDSAGRLITEKLTDDKLASYAGLLGHYHLQSNKVDPGPAFQWDYVVTRARQLLARSTTAKPAAGNARMHNVFCE